LHLIEELIMYYFQTMAKILKMYVYHRIFLKFFIIIYLRCFITEKRRIFDNKTIKFYIIKLHWCNKN
jgi:hypothetical protein